jgi:SulP family sulfate permease
MLDQLTAELRREGIRFVLARDVGQVRDVLREVDADESLTEVYPTVREAVAAIQAGSRDY